ncbi:MAG: L-serine ammonia-lyase, iron-sulfur-dependent, subunit alpha [Cetobacterium sp.]|uniref:L-cysteine desulfidase family protein n=2 Tax=Cetobacterium TaxID=180162 RepID=UPI00163D18B8|nr:serine dehydratase subunit alpha family protein [Cetobacterium sp. 2A]
MGKTITDKILNILKEEIVPAEGCTEPIALAYAAAKAVEVLGQKPERMKVYLSGNIIKNVKSVIVPNSGGLAGIEASVAMGAIVGDSSKELLVISNVNPENLKEVQEFLDKDIIEVYSGENDLKLYIKVETFAGENSSSIEIKHLHTNITKIEKDGKVLISQACNDGDFNSPLSDREILSIELIYKLAKTIDIDLISDLFKTIIKYNTKIAKEGLTGNYGVNAGKMIMDNIETGFYGNDLRNKSAAFAGAGSDARMSGCALPVMTTSGSGNQGMTASLPIIKYCEEKNISEENLIRALFVSHLTTVHVKTNVGRLSAYCGAICASAGVSAALAFLNDGTYEMVSDSISNTLGNLSGVICDGAKASCALKIISGVYSAFDSTMLAMQSSVLQSGDGIISNNIENTIKNVGILAGAGMKVTDEVILDIMVSNRK